MTYDQLLGRGFYREKSQNHIEATHVELVRRSNLIPAFRILDPRPLYDHGHTSPDRRFSGTVPWEPVPVCAVYIHNVTLYRYGAQCTPYPVYTLQSTLYTLYTQCTVYTVPVYTLYGVHCTCIPYIVSKTKCTLCSVHCNGSDFMSGSV